ncbi:unnamed protein product, partial [Leuciscus chuanchicus]
WIDEDFTLKKAVLHSQECSGSHTAAAIASAFESMFGKWKIERERVDVVLRDNGRNMAKAMMEFGVATLPCMAHTLQLAVHDGVLSQRSVADVVALAYSQLEDVQKELGMSVKRLQQDVATRWNSTFYMMRSLVEQKRALGAYAADFELPATLTANQDISSAEASAADVIPAVVALTRLLGRPSDTDRGVQTTKTTLLEAVNRRFNGVHCEALYSVATMLDARYKGRYFDEEKKRSARDLLLKVLDDMSGSADASTEDPPEKRTRTGLLLDMYDEILEENVMFEEQDKTASASQVISCLAEPTIPRNHSPLEYWKCNQARFPALGPAARKYLCAPCTSIDSEWLFSVASDVIDDKRNRMDGEKAEMLIFVKKNLPLVLKKS